MSNYIILMLLSKYTLFSLHDYVRIISILTSVTPVLTITVIPPVLPSFSSPSLPIVTISATVMLPSLGRVTLPSVDVLLSSVDEVSAMVVVYVESVVMVSSVVTSPSVNRII